MNNLKLADKLQDAAPNHYGDLCGMLWDAGAALRNLHTENTALRVTEDNLRQELQECQDQRRAAFRRIEELEAMRAQIGQGEPDDAAAKERDRILSALKRHDWHSSNIWRYYYPSSTGDWVDLRELRKLLAYAQPAQQAEQHPDDAAVDRFAAAMKDKLAIARQKGRGGWETCSAEELGRMLREHVEKGDPRDVANFCMFLWSLGYGIAPQASVMAAKAAHNIGEKK